MRSFFIFAKISFKVYESFLAVTSWRRLHFASGFRKMWWLSVIGWYFCIWTVQLNLQTREPLWRLDMTPPVWELMRFHAWVTRRAGTPCIQSTRFLKLDCYFRIWNTWWVRLMSVRIETKSLESQLSHIFNAPLPLTTLFPVMPSFVCTSPTQSSNGLHVRCLTRFTCFYFSSPKSVAQTVLYGSASALIGWLLTRIVWRKGSSP